MDKPYKLFLRQIASFIAPDRIYTDELRRFARGVDAGFYQLIPEIVVSAANEQEVVQLLTAAASRRIPVTFRAAGTSLSGQSITNSVLVLAGKGWEKYSLSPQADTITLQPGIVGDRVNRILKPFGKRFPPDPASVKSAMVGGIVMNNASGMSCGTHANSDKVIVSARIVLPCGTVLDTGDARSRADFNRAKPAFVPAIEELRNRIRSNPELVARIRRKYSIKNVMGLNLLPFIEYDDPFSIITHLMVGSEGTLAFLSEVTMRTEAELPCKASAFTYFDDIKQACQTVIALNKLTDAAGHRLVTSAEMLDDKALIAVGETQAGETLTALLLETKAATHEELAENIATIQHTLNGGYTTRPVVFTDKEEEYSRYWTIRSGVFPAVGGNRVPGTTCLIEDVAFHPDETLPDAVAALQQLLQQHGYADACIYGHALEGNFHFILNQSFQSAEEVDRYDRLMHDLKTLVVDAHDGSLKAEHGTGRNMASFVKAEWGQAAWEAMREVKQLFDPEGLLNPGVIFNPDPHCHLKHLKPLPLANPIIDKCIECGFCEVNCLSCGLTLSSRQRIAVYREMTRLQQTAENPARLAALQKQFNYYGLQTCAGDGLCSTSCPMKINTGDLTHHLRGEKTPKGGSAYKAGLLAARRLAACKSGVRGVLRVAHLGHRVLGTPIMSSVTTAAHRFLHVPLWTPAMPLAYRQPDKSMLPVAKTEARCKVVYFPSCINQTMGVGHAAEGKMPVVNEMIYLLHKAGYEVIFPEGMADLCCGTIWESKGMEDIANQKTAELQAALWQASEQGKYPVLCDQSPCLYRMRHTMPKLKLYEPVEFIYTFLRERLTFTPVQRNIAIHITCSMRKMGLDNMLLSLARLCAQTVVIPDETGCCGFAGDKGFVNPEVNKYALRNLKQQIEQHHVTEGYSNSRTCEIGLTTHSGIAYTSIVTLVNSCTERR